MYLALADGRKLPLPYPMRLEEFAFTGNVQVQSDERIIAAYEPSTSTGCIYWGQASPSYWMIMQPVARDDFFRSVLPATIAGQQALDVRASHEAQGA